MVPIPSGGPNPHTIVVGSLRLVQGRGAVVITVLAGLVAGTIAAVVLGPGGDGTASVGTTSTPSGPAPTVEAWVRTGETRLGPVIFLPEAVGFEGDQIVLSYGITALVPAEVSGMGPSVPAAPASFTLAWSGGEIPARVVAPTSRAARFRVPTGFTLDQITAIRIDSYWIAAPARFPFEVSPSSGSWVPIAPGLKARLLQEVGQSGSWLVIVEIDSAGTPMTDLFLTAEGREWVSASRSLLATPRWTLTFTGARVPDPVPLLATGIAWVEVPAGAAIDLEGLRG
jgi:hypothetical protein